MGVDVTPNGVVPNQPGVERSRSAGTAEPRGPFRYRNESPNGAALTKRSPRRFRAALSGLSVGFELRPGVPRRSLRSRRSTPG